MISIICEMQHAEDTSAATAWGKAGDRVGSVGEAGLDR